MSPQNLLECLSEGPKTLFQICDYFGIKGISCKEYVPVQLALLPLENSGEIKYSNSDGRYSLVTEEG